MLRRLLCISKPIVPVTCLFLEVFLPLLNFCVNLFIDLKTELSLVQTLSLNVIKYYTRQNTPVCSCFFYASKAFDRVNHWKLFRKIIIRKVPLMIVRRLFFWYSKQEMCIK